MTYIQALIRNVFIISGLCSSQIICDTLHLNYLIYWQIMKNLTFIMTIILSTASIDAAAFLFSTKTTELSAIERPNCSINSAPKVNMITVTQLGRPIGVLQFNYSNRIKPVVYEYFWDLEEVNGKLVNKESQYTTAWEIKPTDIDSSKIKAPASKMRKALKSACLKFPSKGTAFPKPVGGMFDGALKTRQFK